ncbi:MAG: cyclase family protein [Anaerolineae bacterium]
MKIIDLSQEIYAGMPVFKGHPEVEIQPADTHERRAGIENPTTISPTVHRMTLGEHAGTHVDAFNHFRAEQRDQGIDTMPLEMFFTSAICLDVSDKGLLELIEVSDIEAAVEKSGEEVRPMDTVLLYSDHYRRYFGTDDWVRGPGVSADVARWFGDRKVAAFGVETRSPGVSGISNVDVHTICGEMGYTHYENLINLHQLVGIGRFQFIGLPLKIRGGTGSPVRAVAIVDGMVG